MTAVPQTKKIGVTKAPGHMILTSDRMMIRTGPFAIEIAGGADVVQIVWTTKSIHRGYRHERANYRTKVHEGLSIRNVGAPGCLFQTFPGLTGNRQHAARYANIATYLYLYMVNSFRLAILKQCLDIVLSRQQKRTCSTAYSCQGKSL
jgi:hypothetical protein